MPNRKPVEVWREKLKAMQIAEASEADAEQKFELRQRIAEVKEKIEESERDAPSTASAVPLPISPSRLFRGQNKGPAFLLGREKELADLDAVWNDTHKKNIVTIVAWGGIGKSSLVAHWAAAKLAQSDRSGIERYFDWTFFSQGTRREGDPTGASNVGSGLIFIKEALEFFGEAVLAASNTGGWKKGERLAQVVAQKRTLLVLDGLEPLQDAKSGELRDEALSALLRALAANNKGLCLITTRQHLPDLDRWHPTTAPEWKLSKLSKQAGGELLTRLGVSGSRAEREKLAEDLKGHALTLTLLGKYLAEAHGGDIRKRDLVSLSEADYEETSGHAFHVMEAYEEWLEKDKRIVEVSILRLLGLFDRPATPDCIEALRQAPAIPGLTDSLINLSDAQWNLAVKRVEQLGLLEEQPWEPRRIVGFSLEEAKKAIEASDRDERYELPKAKPLENHQSYIANPKALDAHPLIREFFKKRLRETDDAAWKGAHSRLLDHLRNSVPYWPEGLEGLQPLYQAVVHGCQAGRYQETYVEVYMDRILRTTSGTHNNYSKFQLGAIGADLAAVGCFFILPWTRLAPELAESDKAWLLNEAAFILRAAGRLIEARQAQARNLEMRTSERSLRRMSASAGNLSELDLILGDVESAVREAEQSVDFANRSKNVWERMVKRSTLANALHQAGQAEKSAKRFEEAEAMQKKSQAIAPLLYSVRGFDYCELLLSDAERAAWRAFLSPQSEITNAKLVECCRSVSERATQTLKWIRPLQWLLDIALDHLTLGRASLYAPILENFTRDMSHSAGEHLDAAVQGLKQAGDLSHFPRSLFPRAWLHVLQNEPTKAQELLDEAWQIAERGPMRLHLADVYLHRARLFFRTQPYPWGTSPDGTMRGPRDDLVAARELIERCGYGRRIPELEDAERVIPII